MRLNTDWKSIFCLEGVEDSKLTVNSSVKPVLNLLNRKYPKMKHIHADYATKTELEFYLEKWLQKTYNGYPLLYLALHGEKNEIKFADGDAISLDDLAKTLAGQCSRKFIIFASCSTLDIDLHIIKRFIKTTHCFAVCSYKSDVDRIKSTAFELLLLQNIQDNEFAQLGLMAMKDYLTNLSKKAFPDLKFRMVTSTD